MAGGQERILRRRIKSVQSTKKITRAMELIASSRIVRAQAAVRAAQPYSEGITNVVEHLAEAGAGGASPLLSPRPEVRTIGQIVIAADRGLCGGYNTSVLRVAESELAGLQRNAERITTELQPHRAARPRPTSQPISDRRHHQRQALSGLANSDQQCP